MATDSIEGQALAAARAVAAGLGVACERAQVICSASNVLVHLQPSPVVARVMTGTVALHEHPARWLGHEVSLLSFLAPSGLAVAPSSLVDPGPYRAAGLWMTFWEWVEGRQAGLREGPERLGRALRDLHDELAAYSGDLPDFVDLRNDVERLHRQLRPTPTLSAEEIDSLRSRLRALDDTVFAAPWRVQALHGDASLSNLLCGTAGRLVWNDLEDTFRGPIEWDLAGYMMSLEDHGADAEFLARALDAYGGVEMRELAPLTPAHEVYGEIWRYYDAQRRSRTGP